MCCNDFLLNAPHRNSISPYYNTNSSSSSSNNRRSIDLLGLRSELATHICSYSLRITVLGMNREKRESTRQAITSNNRFRRSRTGPDRHHRPSPCRHHPESRKPGKHSEWRRTSPRNMGKEPGPGFVFVFAPVYPLVLACSVTTKTELFVRVIECCLTVWFTRISPNSSADSDSGNPTEGHSSSSSSSNNSTGLAGIFLPRVIRFILISRSMIDICHNGTLIWMTWN